jgi:hypothetical protein
MLFDALSSLSFVHRSNQSTDFTIMYVSTLVDSVFQHRIGFLSYIQLLRLVIMLDTLQKKILIKVPFVPEDFDITMSRLLLPTRTFPDASPFQHGIFTPHVHLSCSANRCTRK